MSTEKIKELAEKYYPEVVELRHYFHMYPELAFEEVKTAAKVAETLEKLGIEVQTGLAKTGVVGLIRGGKPGKTVLLRADMDALKVQETADVPYRSKVPGVMHSCGHDGHTAGLLGAAMILNDMKEDLSGNVKLVFQPAEEDDGGALPMIEEGVMENPKVDAAFGCHLWGNLVEGKVQFKKGSLMASPDAFDITIIGKGGHAAMPHLSIDPVVMAAQVIDQTQAVISRRKSPLDPAVVSFTMVHGGDAYNVIPNEVKLAGTIRTLDHQTRKWIPEAMEAVVKGVTEAGGGSYEFSVKKRFPPLINNDEMTDVAMDSAEKIVGRDNIAVSKEPNMGGEDFAYFAQEVPSCYFFVGIAKSEDEPVSHHHPEFQWNDRNMILSMEALAQVAVDYLNRD
jgi:amidohydrolase